MHFEGEPETSLLTIHPTLEPCFLGICWNLREAQITFLQNGPFLQIVLKTTAISWVCYLLSWNLGSIGSSASWKDSDSGSKLNPLGQTVAHVSFQSIIFKSLKREVLMFVAMRHPGVWKIQTQYAYSYENTSEFLAKFLRFFFLQIPLIFKLCPFLKIFSPPIYKQG